MRPKILIVGGGIGGLTAALKCAAFADVQVFYKTSRQSSASAWAQGGIAAVQDKEDSFASHIEDTLRAGYGLCHEKIVRKCVENAPARLQDLRDWGVAFNVDLHREGGHHHHRIAHIADHTGRSIMEQLLQQAAAHPHIQIFEDHMAIDLILDDHGTVQGLYILNRATGQIEPWPASAVVLATGGAGRVYLYSSNPPEANGDGIAIALRAGCRAANMEFFQFHPTLFYHPQQNMFLITEALRGAGARLLTRQMQLFTDELLPRDQVARSIDREMKRSGSPFVFLDCRQVSQLEERFPQVLQTCRRHGVDPATECIPVVPGAHYCCGGIVVDEYGRTELPGLFVLGEIAFTGLHGANRLASNSLLEALVFAHEVAERCRDKPLPPPPTQLAAWNFGNSKPLGEEVLIAHLWSDVRRCMWDFVGIVRSDQRLNKAVQRLREMGDEIHELYWNCRPTVNLLELRNLCTVAQTIAEAALQRRESRGLHYNVDLPVALEEYRGEFHCSLDPFGRLHWNWTD